MITGQIIRIAKEHILGHVLTEIRMAKQRKRDEELVTSVVTDLELRSPAHNSVGARWQTVGARVNSRQSARAAFGERRSV